MAGKRIMIVEDNTLVAEDCKECLKGFGYTITSIQTSGPAAIARAKTEHPDLVLMDIKLHGSMDGIEAARQIVSHFNIPIVFLSAYSDPKLLERTRQVGAFGYLIKPFEERELHATIEVALYKIEMEKKHRQLAYQKNKIERLKAIGIFAGGIAHDLNNLLFAIMGNISLAAGELQSTTPSFQKLKDAEKACARAKELTQKLITFSMGGAPLREKKQIDTIIMETVNAIFSKSDITPQFFFPPRLVPVDIDVDQIKQVVSHIAANAMDAASADKTGFFKVKGKNVKIREQDVSPLPQGVYVKLNFLDNGCGIPEQHIDNVFDPYYSTKEMGAVKGQGLGLAVCHAIISQHHGLITVKSRSGIGTDFSIYLPAHRSAAW